MKNHLKKKHRTEKCRKVNKAETSEEDDNEYDSDLENLEPVTCIECPEQFNDWSDLCVHLEEVHTW